MRFLKVLFLLGSMLTSCFSYAQSYSAKISGSIVSNAPDVIPGVTISLFKGFDSLTSTKTDLDGLFLLELELMDQSDYILKIANGKEFPINDELKFQTEMYRSDFVFELEYPRTKLCELKSLTAYYLANETKTIENFEVEHLLDLLKEHPEICIEFAQVIIHSESEKTAKKRMAHFKKHLENSGADMSCLRFDEKVRFLSVFQDDQRSRIDGAIYSLASKCEK